MENTNKNLQQRNPHIFTHKEEEGEIINIFNNKLGR